MAPVTQIETELESRLETRERHRVLIAAAIVALVGSRFRILEISPAEASFRGELEKWRPYLESGHARLLAAKAGFVPKRPARRRNVRLRITLEDRSYDVAVELLPEPEATGPEEDPPAAVPESVLEPPHLPDTMPEDRICRSPIAGVVVSIEVSPRQRIRQDDPVATIEAMKMQNTIGAPLDGVVEEVLVRLGETVKTGQILCKLA
jgi:biotin carboxyl carrier protein